MGIAGDSLEAAEKVDGRQITSAKREKPKSSVP